MAPAPISSDGEADAAPASCILMASFPPRPSRNAWNSSAIAMATIKVFGYSRDVLLADECPTQYGSGPRLAIAGNRDRKPDVIFFDSVMCLLVGKMGEEDSWAPIKDLVRQISSRRIAQIWLHHTGHDASRGYGTKTREWEMDTVMMLSKVEE